jgi:hypothetical protein
VRLATKVVLGVVHLALGGVRRRKGPSESAALERLRRLGEPAGDLA